MTNNIPMIRFGCPSCQTPLTPMLRALPEFLAGDNERCTQSAASCYRFIPDEKRRPEAPIAILPSEMQGLIEHEDRHRLIGCCGVGYRERLPNLRCATCKEEIAYRESDGDHIWHAIYIPSHELERSSLSGPSDDELRARLEAHRVNPNPPPTVFSWEEMIAALMPSPLFDYDPEYMPEIPALRSFDVSVHEGGEVCLWLNEQPIMAPWSKAERERVLTLGRMPGGRPTEPIIWWYGHEAPTEGENKVYWQHEWTFWQDKEDVFVVWQWRRQRPREPVLAFRIDAAYWEYIWESKTIPT
jgi:hypothetical protein